VFHQRRSLEPYEGCAKANRTRNREYFENKKELGYPSPNLYPKGRGVWFGAILKTPDKIINQKKTTTGQKSPDWGI